MRARIPWKVAVVVITLWALAGSGAWAGGKKLLTACAAVDSVREFAFQGPSDSGIMAGVVAGQ